MKTNLLNESTRLEPQNLSNLQTEFNKKREKVHKDLVHKSFIENVLIGDLQLNSTVFNEDFTSQYLTFLDFDPNHAFFFEHERKHVPGLLLIEAVRQNAMAITHKYFDIPITQSFIMNEFNCSFFRFAALDVPIKLFTAVEEKRSRSGRLNGNKLRTMVLQQGKTIMTANGSLVILSDVLMRRLETNILNV